MFRRRVLPVPAAGVAFASSLAIAGFVLAQDGPEREFLIQESLAIPGYEIVLTEASLGVGEREGRHTHPGTLVGYMLEGELTLEQQGVPTVVLKPGDSVVVEPEQIHEGINTGDVPVKALAMFIVRKDEPLSMPAP